MNLESVMPLASPREAVVHLYLPHFLSSGFSSSHIICVGCQHFKHFPMLLTSRFNKCAKINNENLSEIKALRHRQTFSEKLGIWW